MNTSCRHAFQTKQHRHRYPVRQTLLAVASALVLWPVAHASVLPTLETVVVTGDWLADGNAELVANHPGARNVVTRETFQKTGALTVRQVLNQIPGVNAPVTTGIGDNDIALNIGIRGLNPRLSTRSTVLVDGVPVPYAPYGQPQLSFAALSLGNIESVDVIRGGGSVRYGPQNVGGIVNFVTRPIPTEHFEGDVAVKTVTANGRARYNVSSLLGGTLDNGLGGAILFSSSRGQGYRDNSGGKTDDLILKTRYRLDHRHQFDVWIQHYTADQKTPGGLTAAAYAANRYQSTRPFDRFFGERNIASASWTFTPTRTTALKVSAFHTNTLRSGFLEQGARLTLSPRRYWVNGIETRVSHALLLGPVLNEFSVGHRIVRESTHERRYTAPTAAGILPTENSPFDRDTRGHTIANAVYVDDKISFGKWEITPGIRFESIRLNQRNNRNGRYFEGKYNVVLPALNVLYRHNEALSLYANTEGSFGSVQFSRLPNAVRSGRVGPEKARTWEAGVRFKTGSVRGEAGLFLINFSDQYESNQIQNTVFSRGKTRHRGFETALAWDLKSITPALSGLEAQFSYALVDARIREDGPNQGHILPFSSRHKGTFGLSMERAQWSAYVRSAWQSSQFSDSANTVAENAAGNNGRIAGFMTWEVGAKYRIGQPGRGLTLSAGIENLFNKATYTRSLDDNNRGKYAGAPRSVFIQLSKAF